MDSFPSFHPKIIRMYPRKIKKLKTHQSYLDPLWISVASMIIKANCLYKVQLEKTKSGALRQKQIPEEIKNTDSTITICIGMPEMFVQKAKMIDEMYKNNNNTNGNNVTEADSLYKINVRNCVKPN